MSVPTEISVAWISRGRLFVKKPGIPLKEIESDFARQSLQRDIRDSQLNAWKGRSGVWGNLGMQPPGVPPWENPDPRRQIRFVTVARGSSAEEIFYVLDMGTVGGLFSYNMETDIERRLVHRQGFVLRHLSRHPVNGEIAMSLPRDDGTVGLKITRSDGLFGKDIALSDSLDDAPCWHADGSRRLVFHSAMIGRNEHGYAVGQSPFRLELMDLESEELKVIHEEENSDLLQPRLDQDGSLTFIRRPYKPVSQQRQISFFDMLKDVILFPYRLIRTFVFFFNFMSMMFAGKPLISAGGPETNQQKMNPYMMLWGQAVDTQRALGRRKKENSPGPLVPDDWMLIRRSADCTEAVLGTNVLSWDISSSGHVAYTDGRTIFQRAPDGTVTRIVDSDLIEKIVVLG